VVSAQATPPPVGPRKSSFVADLRVVLAERDFRRLFTSRLVSQAGDGVFNAGFTAYAFFGAATFPDPLAAVDAFAVLYLPYSLIGPFAGVFIDRWSRRQIVVWGALIRAAMVVVASLIVATGASKYPLYVSVLAVLGANRFFLSAVSAGTPHVVQSDKLVMANAVAPTSGTVAGFLGGLIGLAVPYITGGGHVGSAVTLLFGGACYAVAGLLGLRLDRDILGPSRAVSAASGGGHEGAGTGSGPSAAASRAGLAHDLADVAGGLWSAVRHLGQRRKAAYALGAVGVHRALYGVLLVQGLLLYRNYFYPGGSGHAALGHAAALVATSAIGFGLAAVVTPIGTKRLGTDAWIAGALLAGAVATVALGPTFNQVAFLLLGLLMGLSAQSVKICVDTTVQQEVDDVYMGRVFALYDMLYNVAFVIGPALAVPFLPATGKSYAVVAAIGAGYLVAAAAYAALTLRRTPTTGAPGFPPPRPTAAVRR
jgi:MFS family permease